MTSTTASPQSSSVPAELNARSLLLPYVLGLTLLCALLQLVIVIDGNRIGMMSTLLSAGVALYYAAFIYTRRKPLGQVRFARLVAHATTYAVVNTSFQLHAAILGMAGSEVLRGHDYLPVDSGWFGPTFAMAGFWGIGLTIHAIASIAQRGFED
ncbi:MAG: hypothetical protein R2754_03975 [Microthrixaceae bacterium]